MGDRAAAPQVAEAEAVVAVDQDSRILESFHGVPCLESPVRRPRIATGRQPGASRQTSRWRAVTRPPMARRP
jgi:hypothetical protein